MQFLAYELVVRLPLWYKLEYGKHKLSVYDILPAHGLLGYFGEVNLRPEGVVATLCLGSDIPQASLSSLSGKYLQSSALYYSTVRTCDSIVSFEIFHDVILNNR